MLRNDSVLTGRYSAPMALSNAERQARYRARMKARANGDAVLDHVGNAVDEAVDALWAFFNRPGPGGGEWDDIIGCATLADYRALLARDPAALVDACRGIAWLGEGLSEQEAAAIRRVLGIADRLALKPQAAQS